MTHSITIVIASWNRKGDLLECLASLREMPPPPPRIIVVNNASEDGTREAVAAGFPEVTVLDSPVNRGFAGGNNLGIRKAREEGAEYICLLNNDTVVRPDFLTSLTRAAEKRPRAAILGARVVYYQQPELIWSDGIEVGRWSGQIRARHYRRSEKGITDKVVSVDAVSGAALLLRSRVLDEIGLFDERYFLCFEDVDLCLRARDLGYSVLTVPSSRVLHKVSGSMGGEGSPTVVYYATRNHLLALNRRLPVPAAWRPIRNCSILG